ncbi:hypothetical protein ACFFF5_14760 [Lederbergia wuyishanensis]|uniref:Uncharacterized protein n=1 Tax=Lederbergia wuyishanensis TaxID=1347903 RepID=A0ABU0D3B4_9BACI|nr:hypothetical protein [Lederbergia wuyishanensis]MCJ8007960.1 hypothetical protein [Lederbergia wuyishanensis]MDQ0342870.1 hypothetical protein [Lederbergia wuyishanensis]
MRYLIELERIMSVGERVVNQYELVFKGELTDKNNSTYPIFRGLKPLERTPIRKRATRRSKASNIIISFPLSAKTYIKMNVYSDFRTWQISVLVDLNNWKFTIEPFYNNSIPLTYEVSTLILSSIGIQKGKKILSLNALSNVK